MHSRRDNSRTIRARTGPDLVAKSWATEAAVRMLQNNLDPAVAEAPEELVVYGGIGRAARDWASFDRIVETLERLEGDETLLVQSGKPVGVFRTHADAPRVLIANSNLVPKWATWDHFHELDRKGLMMYGQMTAGSWIYIGTQGIVQGTYETFAEMGRQHYGGDLKGRWILTAGLGGMGGAQPLAAVMAGRALPGDRMPGEPDREEARDPLSRPPRRIARRGAGDHPRPREAPTSVGLLGNAAEILAGDGPAGHPSGRGDRPDLGARPGERLSAGRLDRRKMDKYARAGPGRGGGRCKSHPWRCMFNAMLAFREMGVPTFDYGNNIRQVAKDEGVEHAFDFPGFVPAYVRPLFCRGIGPFRWAALSGDPEDIYRTDARVKELIPDDPHLHRWLDMARERIAFQGLPARICWVGLGQRHRLGMAFNEMVALGRAQGAGRHRPRPSRFGLGGEPQSRDRSDEGRLRRGLRLAPAQRPAQHRLGRDLGVAPSWRRSRDGLFAACRNGDRRRRHSGGRRGGWSGCSGTTRAPA